MIDLKKKLYIKLGHEYILHKSDGNCGYIGTIENGREIFYHRVSGNVYAKSSPTKNKHPFEDPDFDLTNDSLGIINEVKEEVPKAPLSDGIFKKFTEYSNSDYIEPKYIYKGIGQYAVAKDPFYINDDDNF